MQCEKAFVAGYLFCKFDARVACRIIVSGCSEGVVYVLPLAVIQVMHGHVVLNCDIRSVRAVKMLDVFLAPLRHLVCIGRTPGRLVIFAGCARGQSVYPLGKNKRRNKVNDHKDRQENCKRFECVLLKVFHLSFLSVVTVMICAYRLG